MDKKKKNMKIALSVTVAISIVFIGMYVFGIGPFSNKGDELKLYNETDVKTLTESYKTEFMVYGSDLSFDNGCYTRYIDEITESNLTSDDSFVYKVLVLNDLDGAITFTQEVVDIIKNKMDNDELSVLYLGADSYKFANTELFSGGVTGGHKEYLIMGMLQEVRNVDYKTATVVYWDEGVYDDYKAGRHYSMVNAVMSEAVSSITLYFN